MPPELWSKPQIERWVLDALRLVVPITIAVDPDIDDVAWKAAARSGHVYLDATSTAPGRVRLTVSEENDRRSVLWDTPFVTVVRAR